MHGLFSVLITIVVMNTLLPYRLLLATWFCVLLNTLCAQSPSYHRYTTADGLPTNYVYGVVEDKEGYIWAYTENGLAKFDGYTFEHFTTKDGLPGNDVTWALRAPDGKTWLYTYKNRPAYLLEDSIHIVGDESAILRSLLPDGSPWYISQGDSYTYDGKWKCLNSFYISPLEFAHFGQNWRAIKRYPNTPAYQQELRQNSYSKSYTIEEDSITIWNTDNFWLGKYPRSLSTFFYRFNDSLHWQMNQEWLGIPLKSTLPFNLWAIPGQPQKWIIKQSYSPEIHFFLNLNNAEKQYFSLADDGIQAIYHASIQPQDTTFWLVSDAGSVQLDYSGRLLKKLAWPKEEQAWTPLRTYTDREGNIWQGTRNGGLLMIPYAYQSIRKRNLPSSGNQYLKRLLKTPDDRVLGITENGQIYDIGTDTIKRIYQAKSDKYFRTAAWLDDQLLLSFANELLLLSIDANTIRAQSFTAIYNNCFWFDLHQRVPLLMPTSSLRNFTSVIYLPAKKQLFSVSKFNVIYRWNLVPANGEPCQISLLTDKARLLYIHPQMGTIYSGDIDGLSVLEKEKLLPFLRHEADLKNISALFGTPDKLWIGTESNGLFCYHLATKELEKIIPNNHIRAIRPDGNRGVLVATNNGVFIVPAQQPKNFQHFTHLGAVLKAPKIPDRKFCLFFGGFVSWRGTENPSCE